MRNRIQSLTEYGIDAEFIFMSRWDMDSGQVREPRLPDGLTMLSDSGRNISDNAAEMNP